MQTEFNKQDPTSWRREDAPTVIRSVAHDVNNFINYVQGWADLIHEDAENDKLDRALLMEATEGMMSHAQQLAKLIQSSSRYAHTLQRGDIITGE